MKRHITITLTNNEANVIFGQLWAAMPSEDNPQNARAMSRILTKIQQASQPTEQASKDFHDTQARAWGGNL